MMDSSENVGGGVRRDGLVDNTQVVFLDGPNGKLITSQTEENKYDKKIMEVGTYNFRGIDTGTNNF